MDATFWLTAGTSAVTGLIGVAVAAQFQRGGAERERIHTRLAAMEEHLKRQDQQLEAQGATLQKLFRDEDNNIWLHIRRMEERADDFRQSILKEMATKNDLAGMESRLTQLFVGGRSGSD